MTTGTPAGFGTAMAGGKGRLATTPRNKNDYYPTPPAATGALLLAESGRLNRSDLIWEPCGRGGAIIRVLRANGFSTVASDIVGDPEHGVIEHDLFEITEPLAASAITNPPFNLSAKMIDHLLNRLDVRYCALLLKGTYWHAANRTALFRARPPARIYALNWRLDFIGGGSPVMECAWVVWDSSHHGPTIYDFLDKPATQADLFGEAS